MMNAIHDLPLLVARDRRVLQRRGAGRRDPQDPGIRGNAIRHHQALRENIFERTMEAPLRPGPVPTSSQCANWGVMSARSRRRKTGPPPGEDRRARARAMSTFAIVTDPKARHLTSRAVEGQADRGEPLQRVALHHAQAFEGFLSASRSSGRSPAR